MKFWVEIDYCDDVELDRALGWVSRELYISNRKSPCCGEIIQDGKKIGTWYTTD